MGNGPVFFEGGQPRAPRLFVLLLVVFITAGRGVVADQGEAHSGAGLGRVEFSASCTPEVQGRIARGVALLHSFQYREADAAFAEAVAHEPGCAMASWGRAMAATQFMWRSPGAGELEAGLGYVKQAEKLAAPTDRERRYIASMAAFFQDNVRLLYVERVVAFSAVMGKLSEKYPDDVDASAFYSLSLITLAHMQPRGSIEAYEYRTKALGILRPRFDKHPGHPGLAHYMIHAADTPELAPQGLEAARVYAQLAPGSAHALHMPSHIFLWLGLWKDATACNLAAAEAGRSASLVTPGDAEYTLHALDFLDYAYLQSGSAAKARALVAELEKVPGVTERQLEYYRTILPARNAFELHLWKEAASLPDPGAKTQVRGLVYLIRAVGAARSGNPEEAQKQAQNLAGLRDTMLWNQVQFEEAEGWLAYAAGKTPEAVELLRTAADEEKPEAADSLLTPAREMLGDLLLELNRPGEALEEYRKVLALNRNRYNALQGAVRAAQGAGLHDEAQKFYSILMKSVSPEADRPDLEQVKTLMAAAK